MFAEVKNEVRRGKGGNSACEKACCAIVAWMRLRVCVDEGVVVRGGSMTAVSREGCGEAEEEDASEVWI